MPRRLARAAKQILADRWWCYLGAALVLATLTATTRGSFAAFGLTCVVGAFALEATALACLEGRK